MNQMALLLLETDEGRKALLERLVDSMGLGSLLGVVAEICREKGDHLDHAWDDVAAAGRWESAADEIDELIPFPIYPYKIGD